MIVQEVTPDEALHLLADADTTGDEALDVIAAAAIVNAHAFGPAGLLVVAVHDGRLAGASLLLDRRDEDPPHAYLAYIGAAIPGAGTPLVDHCAAVAAHRGVPLTLQPVGDTSWWERHGAHPGFPRGLWTL